jgi:outer membrane protein
MRLFRILSLLAGASTLALAQTNTPVDVRQLSLSDCIQLAVQHNLQLQIDRFGPVVSLYTLKANYGDYDPTLSLSGQHDHNEAGNQILSGGFTIPGSVSDDNSFSSTLKGLLPWGMTYTLGTSTPIKDTFGYVPSLNVETNGSVVRTNIPFANSIGAVSASVTQPLLKNAWFDQTRLNIRTGKNRLQYSEVALKLQLIQIITQVEQAYYDLIYSRENVVVQQKAVELAERLVLENKKRLEVGALAPLDLQSAEAQAASSRAALILAQSQLSTQERTVKAFITDQYRDEWANVSLEPSGKLLAPPPVINLQDSWAKALNQRPELLQAKLDVEKQGYQLKYDKNQLLPEVDVFATYGYNGSGKEFSDALYDIQQMDRPFYTYGGLLTLPLSRTRVRNAYKADTASMRQLVLTVKQWEQNIMVAIDNDIATVRANFDQVHATLSARQYEEAALDAEQKKLESGKSTTYTVLQVQRDLTTARGNEIQALDNYNKSLSQLSQDEASTLQRLGVDFQSAK